MLQCVVGFVGATLIVIGVVWTCRQLSSPKELNAAQVTPSGDRSYLDSPPLTRKPTGSLTLSITSDENSSKTISPIAADKKHIRPASGSQLNLTILESNDHTSIQSIADDKLVESNTSFDQLDSYMSQSSDPNISSEPIIQVADPLSQTSDDITTDTPFPQTFSDTEEDLKDLPTTNDDAFSQEQFSDNSNEHDRFEEHNESLGSSDKTSSPSFISNTKPQGGYSPQSTNPQPLPPTQVTALPIGSQQSEDRPITDFENANLSNGIVSNALLQFVNKDSISRPIPDKNILGTQTTQLVISKIAPEEVQINKPSTIVLTVKNLGKTPIKNVILRDSVPDGTQFTISSSNIVPNESNELIWPTFELQEGEEKKFEYTVIPLQEGDFGSVATAMIVVNASCSTKCSKPELKVEVSAPNEIELGQNVVFDIVVTNIGSGTANNVILEETIPDGLHHPSGAILKNGLGSLKSGESKRLPLTLQTVAAGTIVNQLSITADNCEVQKVETPLMILAPMLELSISGPQSIYLEKTATYKLNVKNVGSVSAFDVKLVAQLPNGVSFVKANNLGAYKEDEHSVYWDLAELPAQTNAEIELTLKPQKACQAELIFGANGPNNLTAQTSQTILIDGIAALSFSVTSTSDLIEVGKEFEYIVQIENRGTKSSTNVSLHMLMPEGISVLATDGPTKATNRKGVIVFEKIDVVPAKSSVTYKIKATPNIAGDCRVGFELSSDDLEPLVKEENTRVYE